MLDHHLISDDGVCTAVSDLPTWEIEHLLRDGVEAVFGVTEDQFLERLRIELVVREIG